MESSSGMCPVDKQCSELAEKYLSYCLCSTKDGISLALGIMSVLCWGIAEVPQIITNYKQKSAEGLSVLFVLTWIIGDLFNLFGCKLEPATLPTQYYMALLFTLTTMILGTQTLYYGHIYPRLKSTKQRLEAEAVEKRREQTESAEDLYGFEKGIAIPSSPISLPSHSSHNSPEGEFYYMSARSLSMTHTPKGFSFLANKMHMEQDSIREPLLSDRLSTQSPPPSNTKSLLCVVSVLTFFVGSLNFQQARRIDTNILQQPTGRVVLVTGRKLLQVSEHLGQYSLTTLEWLAPMLGWGMAVIYIGGRLPQIWLNVKRGHFEGINPWMFVFALFGNGTYVASILVSSTEWSKIKPNLPWLVDAGGCCLLDSFILAQFMYFRYKACRNAKIKNNLMSR